MKAAQGKYCAERLVPARRGGIAIGLDGFWNIVGDKAHVVAEQYRCRMAVRFIVGGSHPFFQCPDDERQIFGDFGCLKEVCPDNGGLGLWGRVQEGMIEMYGLGAGNTEHGGAEVCDIECCEGAE